MIEIELLTKRYGNVTAVDENPAEKLEVSFSTCLNNENSPQMEVELRRYDGISCPTAADGGRPGPADRSAAVKRMEAGRAIVLAGGEEDAA